MKPSAIRSLNALIRRGIDDRDLYRRTAAQVSEPGLRVVIEEMAEAVGTVIAGLQKEVVAAGGTPVRSGSTGGAVLRSLASVRIGMASDSDVTGIRWLEQSESRLLVAFEKAATDDGCIRAVAARYLPRLRSLHLDMSMMVQAARS
jgi:uncharacterized protein (TIGR02284 family)